MFSGPLKLLRAAAAAGVEKIPSREGLQQAATAATSSLSIVASTVAATPVGSTLSSLGSAAFAATKNAAKAVAATIQTPQQALKEAITQNQTQNTNDILATNYLILFDLVPNEDPELSFLAFIANHHPKQRRIILENAKAIPTCFYHCLQEANTTHIKLIVDNYPEILTQYYSDPTLQSPTSFFAEALRKTEHNKLCFTAVLEAFSRLLTRYGRVKNKETSKAKKQKVALDNMNALLSDFYSVERPECLQILTRFPELLTQFPELAAVVSKNQKKLLKPTALEEKNASALVDGSSQNNNSLLRQAETSLAALAPSTLPVEQSPNLVSDVTNNKSDSSSSSNNSTLVAHDLPQKKTVFLFAKDLRLSFRIVLTTFFVGLLVLAAYMSNIPVAVGATLGAIGVLAFKRTTQQPDTTNALQRTPAPVNLTRL